VTLASAAAALLAVASLWLATTSPTVDAPRTVGEGSDEYTCILAPYDHVLLGATQQSGGEHPLEWSIVNEECNEADRVRFGLAVGAAMASAACALAAAVSVVVVRRGRQRLAADRNPSARTSLGTAIPDRSPLVAFAVASVVWAAAYLYLMPGLAAFAISGVLAYLVVAPLAISSAGPRPSLFVVLWAVAVAMPASWLLLARSPRPEVLGSLVIGLIYGSLAFVGWAATGGAILTFLRQGGRSWGRGVVYAVVVAGAMYVAFLAGETHFERVHCGGPDPGDCDLGFIDGSIWAAAAFVVTLIAVVLVELIIRRAATRPIPS